MPRAVSLDLQRLGAAYRGGSEDPLTVAREVLRRIAEAGDDRVWISRRPDEAILADARALLARPDRDGLPLFGVPFAVKDNIDVAGLPTTAACPAFAHTPARSAAVVERLLAAGGLLIGKTNMDQFAAGLVGTRSPYGTPRNPFDAAMPPGGSSAGSAVAVASGLVSFALGTDTAGSGRVPASFNNLIGLKPTRGLLSTRGVVPACRSLDCVSVFALTVDDAVAVTAAMAGFDAEDAYSRPPPPGFDLAMPAPRGVLRVGVLAPEDRDFFGDGEAEASYEEVLARAAGAGCRLVPTDFSPFRDAAALLYEAWTAERTVAVDGLLRTRPEALDPVTRAVLAPGLDADAASLFRAQHGLQRLAQSTRQAWGEIDLLLLPTTGTAFSLDQIAAEPVARNADLGRYTNFVNLLDLSALAIPGGFKRTGFPTGVTLVAPAWHDGLLAGVAREMMKDRDLPLGATGQAAPPPARPRPRRGAQPWAEIAVFGAHLSGQPLNPELVALGGVLRRPFRTAPLYRMRLLGGAVERPALVHVGAATGVAIAGEVWSLPGEAVGAFLCSVAAPLGLGTVVGADGEPVTGFVADGGVPADAPDLSHFGDWRSYREARVAPARPGKRVVTIEARPYAFPFDPAACALLIIDMQRDFVEPGGFGEALGNDVGHLRRAIAPTRQLLTAWREAGLPVIHTREGHEPDLSDLPAAKLARGDRGPRIGDPGPMGRILIRGEPGHAIVDELAPAAGEPVIDKPGKGAFFATGLGDVLSARSTRQLVVAGVTTEVCVSTTVREANDRGFDCLVLSDCTASYDPAFHRSALDIIAAQGGIFGWVGLSRAVIAALSEDSR